MSSHHIHTHPHGGIGSQLGIIAQDIRHHGQPQHHPDARDDEQQEEHTLEKAHEEHAAEHAPEVLVASEEVAYAKGIIGLPTMIGQKSHAETPAHGYEQNDKYKTEDA